MSVLQIVFLTHTYLTPILKTSNYRKRIMKSRHKESLLPEVTHQTLPPILIYNMKIFKHKNWGNRAIIPKISIEVIAQSNHTNHIHRSYKFETCTEHTEKHKPVLFWNIKSSNV